MNELKQMKEAYKDMLENISLEQYEEYKKELTNNTFCVICKNNINGDSQYIKGKWYHNDCIENLLKNCNEILDFIKPIYVNYGYCSSKDLEKIINILQRGKNE